MVDQPEVIYDADGHPRFFKFATDVAQADRALTLAAPDRVIPTPRQSAEAFLSANAEGLGVASAGIQASGLRAAAVAPSPAARPALRFLDEKRVMDSTTVGFVQTMFGLPIYQAGISVTTQGPQNAVTAASSTLHYGVDGKVPEK